MPQVATFIEFLNDRGEHTNQHGMTASLIGDGCIHVGCEYPDFQSACGSALEIVRLFVNELEFQSVLAVRTKIEWNQLTPVRLLEMYGRGLMELSCLVERDRRAGVLLFKKDDLGILARDEDTGMAHRVQVDLRCGEDYLGYTAEYFRLGIG